MEQTMEERISTIHFMLKDMFPDATSVRVFANSEGIDVIPTFKTNISNFSMKTITGKWVKKA
jgi:hypothetical protein